MIGIALRSALSAAVVLCAPSFAAAQPAASNEAIARSLFDAARKDMAAGNYAEACPKFAESFRLNPEFMNARFQLGRCYERTGRLASAWSTYRAVATMAKQSGNQTRVMEATEAAEALTLRVPMVTIAVPPGTAKIDGLEVVLDGTRIEAPLWGQSMPVDPGEHRIVARAPGRKAWENGVEMKEAARETVIIGDLELIPNAGKPAPSAMPDASTPTETGGLPPLPLENPRTMPSTRIGAIVAGTAGVAGIVVGSVFGIRSFSVWDEAMKEGGCTNGDPTKCSTPEQGKPKKDQAELYGNISTMSFTVGGVALAGAALLWFLPSAPNLRTGIRFVPTAGPGNAGGVVHGVF